MTTLSFTPYIFKYRKSNTVDDDERPLDRHIASISSNIIICNCDSSPSYIMNNRSLCNFHEYTLTILYSSSASLNRFRIFSSDCPTYLFKTSGPFTIYIFQFSCIILPWGVLPLELTNFSCN